MRNVVQAAGDACEQTGVEVIENIPRENGVEFAVGVLQRVLQKMLGDFLRRERLVEVAGRSVALLFFLGAAKFFPGAEHIVGGDAKSALDEKTKRRLRDLAEIEQPAIFDVTDEPEKILEAVREAQILRIVAGFAGGCDSRRGAAGMRRGSRYGAPPARHAWHFGARARRRRGPFRRGL